MNLRGLSVVDASPANHEVREAIPSGDAFGKNGGRRLDSSRISMTITNPFYNETIFEITSKHLALVRTRDVISIILIRQLPEVFHCAGITTTSLNSVTSAMRANSLPSTTAPVFSEID